jgi:hypothetical protein
MPHPDTPISFYAGGPICLNPSKFMKQV